MAVLIVPGLHDSEPAHWQSGWAADIDQAERIRQQNWHQPDLETWLDALHRHAPRRPGAVLVGHSLGATLIAHLAARFPDLPIGGALLVAPAEPELRISKVQGIAAFGPLPDVPFHFPRSSSPRTYPYMAIERARIIANMWDAAFVDLGDAGHINIASGHGGWAEGLRLLDQLLWHRKPGPEHRPARPGAASRLY